MIPFAGHQAARMLHLAASSTIAMSSLAIFVADAVSAHLHGSDPWRLETMAVGYDRRGLGDGPELLNWML
jgi:hypothetical protein